MTKPLFTLPDVPMIPVNGEDGGYPIGRIFCVGRNYAAHAAEMGFEVDREHDRKGGHALEQLHTFNKWIGRTQKR